MAEDRTIVQPRAPARIGPGTRLSDIYEIDAPLAVGGMGEVFRGHVIETGDAVAIKVMRPEFAQNADALALFRKEASALHNVHHGAVVRYYVFSVDRQLGLPFLAMEYVTGDSLADRLKRGPLDYDEVETLRRRVAGGLAAAHEAGIVHRDVTPDNIILPGGDPARAKIIDFGIARLAETKTVIGTGFAGKYAYASPEQFGLQGGEVTLRSDIYSLGLVLAQASLGRALDMGAEYPNVLAKRSSVPDLAGVDARLVPLLQAMLQPDPRQRPGSMREIEQWGDPATQLVLKPARPEAKAKPGRRVLPLAAGAVILAVAGGLGAFFFLGQPDQTPRPVDGSLSEPKPAHTARPPSPPRPPPPTPPTTTTQPPAKDQSATLAPPPVSSPPVAPPAPPPPPAGPTDDVIVNPAPPPTTMETVAAFIRGYRGGDCFFLNPSTVSAHEAFVEAFGIVPQPFQAFDTDFRNKFGFEAKIHLSQVERGQCPIVDLLALQAKAKAASVPKLSVENDHVRNGTELRGTVDFGDAPNAALLLVDREGTVHDLGRYLKRSGQRGSFAVRLDAPNSNSGRSQLILAVGSRQPVETAAPSGSTTGTALFERLAQDAARPDSKFGVAVLQIKVGN